MISCGKLREAAKAGNIDSLYAVIRKDPYILDRIDQDPFIDTTVQVAVTSGQDDFAVEVMNLKPSLARKLNTDGYSPIHLAIQDERMERDSLHIAAKNNKLEAVQVLAQLLRRTYFYCSSMRKKLLNWKDKDGNTALHVAAYNQPQMIKFLLDCEVKVNEINSSGKTPLDVIQELQTPDEASKRDSMKILRNAEALNASLTPRPRHLTPIIENKYYRPRKSIG
ncbi:ankyrin repeat-containing protein BDA1-like [Gossypium raimondii]|uniref:ankyrin repeat-containing protein BDA1-like n=1 Tax=Gossypium raimondii TaxID=29730 RepID=UPI00227B36E4|nr:ankyrin repeat-containing protein BDA1-like [Gossypium raimondii]